LKQEISEMLAGRMSNQDEDEVEDELEALEAEVSGVKLPAVPSQELEEPSEERAETAKERALRRAREREAEEEPQMIAA
jgi:charged multivesicular body protein 6